LTVDGTLVNETEIIIRRDLMPSHSGIDQWNMPCITGNGAGDQFGSMSGLPRPKSLKKDF